MRPFIVAIFVDDEFRDIEAHDVEECADAYADGCQRGAEVASGPYQSEVKTYVLPRDTADMRSDHDSLEFDCAMEAYAAEMGQQRLAAEHDE